MASRQGTVDLVMEQVAGAGGVSARKMFGEYAVFCEGKMVALICEDRLFVKPTPGGRAHIGDVVEHPPYRGAKPYFLIDGDLWDDRDWMAALIRVTADELPMPRPKSARSAGRSRSR